MGYKEHQRAKTKNIVEQIALERIYRLFELAEQEFEHHKERSTRYVELARKIGTRNKVKIPKELKKQFCKNCGSFLKIGKNCKIRIMGTMMKITCNECKITRKTKIGSE
ncbi:MAG: ribonuclease P protein component 4 [Candidatus Diapherotrites archaeon]|nr:ribonuclease P protein component 4 [Candidatus Diapherotrites archaeon]